MSRLDQHVASVQNKLAFARFIEALAKATLVFAAAVWVAILVDKLFRVRPPQYQIWLWSGLGATVLAAIIYAIVRRPSRSAAAVAIDQKLALKEKISTALYVRPSNDPFALAAVRDAEQTAEKVVIDYWRHFPMKFPRPAYATIAVALLALLTARYMNPLDLFGREEAKQRQAEKQAKVDDAKRTVESALATVNAVPKGMADNEAIKLAKAELTNLQNQSIKDPDATKRSAYKALQDMNAALKEQLNSSQEFAQAQNDAKLLKTMQQPAAGQGPIAEAHRALAKGDFDSAVTQLEQSLEKFDKMDQKEQEKAAEQMKQMAQALQQMAQNPQAQQDVQKQMQQQLGLNQQQAQQAQQLMQQAAQGDKQAQQQLQQMAQQMMQQMNNGQGPNDKQKQQIQQMMQQMQAQANSQQTAQQMAQAAQQIAKQMQQAAQQQQRAQQGQQGSQKQGQQNQPGQQQQQQQQMAQAMKQMQQQMQQMQAAAQDAQQIAAAQQAGQAAEQDAQNAMNGQGAQAAGNQPGGQQGGQQGQQGQQPGQWNGQANNGLQPNNGGFGAGDRSGKVQAPFQVKKEVSPSQDDENGKILASNYIKDNKPIRGESKVSLRDVARAATDEKSDEIDDERISRSAQKVVREYFSSMEHDDATTPSPQQPTTAPSK